MPPSRNTAPLPLELTHGHGEVVYDAGGRPYLDFCAQTLNVSLGHRHPAVLGAVEHAVLHCTHVSSRFANPLVAGLVEALARCAPPGLDRVNIKVTSGSEANEGALKAAYKVRGSRLVVALEGSHHGQTYETLRVSGKGVGSAYVDRTDTRFFPPCRCLRHGTLDPVITCRCADPVADFLDRRHETVAAVIVEPVMVDAGVLIPTHAFLATLRERTARYGIPLLFDEVQTGWGWTSELFACDHYGLAPDALTLSKGLAAGLPLAALLVRAELDVLDYGEHEFTHGANPIACAVAVATLQELIDHDLLGHVRSVAKLLLEHLLALREDHDVVTATRCLGLVGAVELAAGVDADDVVTRCLDRGLLLRRSRVGEGSHVLQLKPPLVTSPESVERAMAVLGSVLAEARPCG
jgi:4-aminobutyrate aminotransferase-like enzyme